MPSEREKYDRSKQASLTVGIIGLGAMGSGMAARLLAAGHLVQGYDINPIAIEHLVQKGGIHAASPSDAACNADVLILMVHNAAQIDNVLFGDNNTLCALRENSVIWIASTVSAEYVIELEQRVSEHQILLVDGPVSGGVTGANSGDLTVIAGGKVAAMEACSFAMQACATQVFHVGGVGAGATIKMINQLLVAAHVALTAEALALGTRAGVNLELLIKVITNSAGNSRIFEKRASRMAAKDYALHTTVNTLLKDLNIALLAAEELGVRTPLCSAAQQAFARAAEAGLGEASDTTLLSTYE